MYKKTEIKPSEKLHQTLIGELSELQVRISGYELSQVIKESISLVKKRNYEKALAKVVEAAKNTHDTLNSLLLIQLKLLIQNHIYSIAELSNQKTQPATIKLDDAANPKKKEVQDTDKDKEKTDDAIEKLRYTEIDEEQFSQVQAFLQKHTTTTFKRDQNVVIISWTKVLCLDFENRETPVDNVARDIKQLEHRAIGLL